MHKNMGIVFKSKVISGTGHRLDPYKKPYDKRKAIDVTKSVLEELKPTKVISGMALGFDTHLALASLELGIPLECAMPYKDFGTRWSSNHQKIRDYILGESMKVTIVSDGLYHISKLQIRNEYLVNNCNTLLAFFNGTNGGTKNCIEYAKKVDKEIINIFEKYESWKY
ncbi:hypothetical protein BPT24_264 [Tenacibaculum phage pT24]|uniref:DUF1273 family protein n=1 Tax=Tenacibaculum phage pT24 TaxID=1880590 RepID=A0A1B4XX49_9CAUD|nr:GTP-binding domain [Tenacibaculum phage pT24]BAV39382.1 hypothetical protein BPT24_264 [Tenacibaculum phage pT24]